MKKIKTVADAFKALNRKPVYPDVSMLPEEEQRYNIACHELKIITEALNEGWKADWDNWNEYKWYPFFDMRKTGFGFTHTNCDHSCTSVGSRLCFKTRELAGYAGRTFTSQYKDFLMV